MSTIEQRTEATTSEELAGMVERQRAAFLAEPFPSLGERRELLGQLAAMVIANRRPIEEAMSADFGVHPAAAADLIEVLGVAGRAGYAAERLEGWMAPEPRDADPALYGSGRAFVAPQPKGVVGNISPWNFPFDLSLGPLVEMLAAGNRVVLKPSEHSPACSKLLREIVRATFEPDRVDVAVGGLELAKEFSRIRWDHLLYTGSPAVGRQIAIAAAEGLVPVTLELGGKCPAILAAGLDRRRVGAPGAGNQGAEERSDVHLGRLLPGAARSARGLRPCRCRSHPRQHARVHRLGGQRRHHRRASPESHP